MSFTRLSLCIRAFVFLLSAAMTLLVQAQTNDDDAEKETVFYDFEIILFKYTNPENFSAEEWTESWNVPPIEDSIEVLSRPRPEDIIDIAPMYSSSYIDGAANSLPREPDYQRLSSSAFKLNEEAEKLIESERFEIISHQAWRQPGTAPQDTLELRLRAGKAYSLQNIDSRFPTIVYEIDGTIKVVLGRYLHVYTDLLYMHPIQQIEKSASAQQTTGFSFFSDNDPVNIEFDNILSTADQPGVMLHGYNFKKHRRMRSKRLHHIDHPMIGMLIYAERVEPEPLIIQTSNS